MTKDELIALTELAWAAACEARISDAPMLRGQDAYGQPVLDVVRFQTYGILLGSIVPKSVVAVMPKEPWQE